MNPYPLPPGNLQFMPTAVPIGSVIAFAGLVQLDRTPVLPKDQVAYTTITASQGWLVCDGSLLSKDEYGMLHAALGDLYKEEGDTDDTLFRIPDYRGYFLRMVDWGTTPPRDPDIGKRVLPDGDSGTGVGSIQQDALQVHVHDYQQASQSATATSNQPGLVSAASSQQTGPPVTQTGTTPPVNTSTETRPKNVYVYYLIKFI